MTELLFTAGVLFSFAFVGLLLLRRVLGQIVPDDEPDYTAEAHSGLTDSEEED